MRWCCDHSAVRTICQQTGPIADLRTVCQTVLPSARRCEERRPICRQIFPCCLFAGRIWCCRTSRLHLPAPPFYQIRAHTFCFHCSSAHLVVPRIALCVSSLSAFAFAQRSYPATRTLGVLLKEGVTARAVSLLACFTASNRRWPW